MLGKTNNGAVGVYGWSASGFGVRARSDSGTALKVDGTSQFDDAVNVDATVTADAFSGSGAALNSLNAGKLTTGTVNDARLSANIPRKNAANTFTSANVFSSPPSMTGFSSTGKGLIQVDLPAPDNNGTNGRALFVENQGAQVGPRIGLNVHAGSAAPPAQTPAAPVAIWATVAGQPIGGNEGLIAILGETSSTASTGVKGIGVTTGVAGEASDEFGAGVRGRTQRGAGVEGIASVSGGAGVRGRVDLAGGSVVQGAVALRGEAPGGTALQAIGDTELQDTVIEGSLRVEDGVTLEAAEQSGSQVSLRVLGLQQGAGVLIARSNDHGIAAPRSGLSPIGVTGVIVDFGDDVNSLDTPAGTGINIRTTTGPAIRAQSATSPALDVRGTVNVSGRVLLDRLDGTGGRAPFFDNAGTAVIPAGKTAVSIPAPGVRPGDSIVATLQGSSGAAVMVKSALAFSGKLNIVLSKRSAKQVKVAYFVMRGT